MYTVRKQFRFEASHQLPLHDGKCRRLHGHSWIGYVSYRAKELQNDGPQCGMVVDFGAVSRLLKQLVDEQLDHWHLNSSTGLLNPTSEELAYYIYLWLSVRQRELGVVGVELAYVEIEETCTSSARYEP